ncbi:MAG: hypothetical protein ABDH21_03955 [bacterium]
MKRKSLEVFLIILYLLITNLKAQPVKEFKIADMIDETINANKFYVVGFDNTSTYLLAVAPIKDVTLKRQNKNYRVFFINLQDDTVQKMDIPMYNIQQVLFDKDNNKRVFFMGNNLTTLALIDIQNNSYKELSKVEYGKDSFRFFGLIWYENNDIYTVGYYMDKKQNSTDDFVVKVELYNHKVRFINTGFNVSAFEKKLDPITFVFLNHKQIAFVRKGKNVQELCIVDKNFNPQVIHQAEVFSGLDFSENMLLYGYKVKEDVYFCLYDFTSSKIYKQQKIDFYPSYNFISKNSYSIILGDIKVNPVRMDVFVGKKDEDYVLKKVISDSDIGYIKISKDGKYFCFVPKEGVIKVFKI